MLFGLDMTDTIKLLFIIVATSYLYGIAIDVIFYKNVTTI